MEIREEEEAVEGEEKRGRSKEDRGRRELLGSKEIVEEETGMQTKAQKIEGKNRKRGRAQGWKRRKGEDEGHGRVVVREEAGRGRAEERGMVTSNWTKVEKGWRETKMKGRDEG